MLRFKFVFFEFAFLLWRTGPVHGYITYLHKLHVIKDSSEESDVRPEDIIPLGVNGDLRAIQPCTNAALVAIGCFFAIA